MIRLKILSGKYKGKVREMPDDVDPSHILGHLLKDKCKWKIDYSKATDQEAFAWGQADLTMRCIRAFQEGRPVYFQKKTYTSINQVQELEDDIVKSNCVVGIKQDNSLGLIIDAIPATSHLN